MFEDFIRNLVKTPYVAYLSNFSYERFFQRRKGFLIFVFYFFINELKELNFSKYETQISEFEKLLHDFENCEKDIINHNNLERKIREKILEFIEKEGIKFKITPSINL